MFCPKCKDEFRPGFTRCGRCNVDLVQSLSDEAPRVEEREAIPGPLRMGEYCGFLSIDDARHARDRLRERRIRSEIVIRDQPDNAPDQPVREEYWLRVDASRIREVAATLGDVPQVEQETEKDGDSEFACGECGQAVAAEETFCPKCGARFDD